MLGRFPWLAFDRRILALRFLVFFDMVDHATGAGQWLPPVQAIRSSADIVLMTLSRGTPALAARLQP